MANEPTCGKCGGVMTPADSTIHPEYFLHDACLPPELQPVGWGQAHHPQSPHWGSGVCPAAEIVTGEPNPYEAPQQFTEEREHRESWFHEARRALNANVFRMSLIVLGHCLIIHFSTLAACVIIGTGFLEQPPLRFFFNVAWAAVGSIVFAVVQVMLYRWKI